jgi:hypothetical protein
MADRRWFSALGDRRLDHPDLSALVVGVSPTARVGLRFALWHHLHEMGDNHFMSFSQVFFLIWLDIAGKPHICNLS